MTPEPLSLYEILGVSPAADADAIGFAYRMQAKKHHPDAGGSEEAMANLNAAYEVLSDPDRRALYDATGHTEAQAEDAKRMAAYGSIAVEIFKLTNLEQSILKVNLVDYLVKQFEQQREGGMGAIAQNAATITKLQKLLGRMKPRDPSQPNVIERMITDKIAGIEKLQVNNQASIDFLDLTIAILHEYHDTPEGGGFYPYRKASEQITNYNVRIADAGAASPG